MYSHSHLFPLMISKPGIKDEPKEEDSGTLPYPTRSPPIPTVTNTVGVGGGPRSVQPGHALRLKRGPGTTPGYQGAVVPRDTKTGTAVS